MCFATNSNGSDVRDNDDDDNFKLKKKLVHYLLKQMHFIISCTYIQMASILNTC